MKKIFFISVIFVCSLNLNAQTQTSKWMKIYSDSVQTVYVDTTTVKKIDNQISVLSITLFKSPIMIKSLNKEAYQLKTQLLFNAASKKYTQVGTLYYDEKFKILGESSLPGQSSGSEQFSFPISENRSAQSVFDWCLDYLSFEIPADQTKDFSKISQSGPVTTIPAKTLPGKNYPDPEEKTPQQNDVRIINSVIVPKDSLKSPSNEIPVVQKETAAKSVDELKPIPANSIPSESIAEKNIRDMIFFDGSKYIFQVSSWRNKAKANSELSKLKREGHNAFLQEAVVRGNTWYRVRVGYFDSAEEAENYMNRLK